MSHPGWLMMGSLYIMAHYNPQNWVVVHHPYVNAATPPDLHSTRRVCIDLQAKLLQPRGETKTAPPRNICVAVFWVTPTPEN